jgi:hypothetical protein
MPPKDVDEILRGQRFLRLLIYHRRYGMRCRTARHIRREFDRRIMLGALCGDSVGQAAKTGIMPLTTPQEGYGCREKQGCLPQAQARLFVAT